MREIDESQKETQIHRLIVPPADPYAGLSPRERHRRLVRDQVRKDSDLRKKRREQRHATYGIGDVDWGKRSILLGVSAGAVVLFVQGASYGFNQLTQQKPIEEIMQDEYAIYTPLYGEIDDASKVPDGLDFFYRQLIMDSSTFRKDPASIVEAAQIDDKVLEKLARQGTKIIFGDNAYFDDRALRSALIADKVMTVAQTLNKGEKLKIGVNVLTAYKDNIQRYLKKGFADSSLSQNPVDVILQFNASVFKALIDRKEGFGSLDNVCKAIVVSLPPTFRAADLKDPEKRKFITSTEIVDVVLKRELEKRGIKSERSE